jgi:transposase
MRKRLIVPATIKLPLTRPISVEAESIIVNRYLLGDSYREIKAELGCHLDTISAVARKYKLKPRNSKRMGKARRRNNCAQPPQGFVLQEEQRVNAALAATAETQIATLGIHANVQRLTAEYLGQLQGLVHSEVTRVEITKRTGGEVELIYDLVERHTHRWP